MPATYITVLTWCHELCVKILQESISVNITDMSRDGGLGFEGRDHALYLSEERYLRSRYHASEHFRSFIRSE